MGIAASSVLVELNISSWGASKIDKSVADTVNATHNATRDASKVYKNLTAGSTLASDIAKYAAKVRLYHNETTLPWSSKGARILPVKLVMEYKQQMNMFRTTYDNMCNQLYAQYLSIISTAQQNLGALYNADDYPTLDEVKSKYAFRLVFSPLPEAGDWRLDVSNDDLKELQASYESDFNDRLAKAVREPWDRLYDELQALSEKLHDEEGIETKKRYHDSLLENPQHLCSLLTKLNITGDPKLEEARRDLERALIGVDIDDIKEYQHVRSDVKSKVDAIIEKFDW